MSNRIDIQRVIDEQELGKFQIGMLVFSFLVMMVDSFDAYSIAYVAPSIIDEWQVSRVAFTAVFTANVAGLAFGAIFFGMLADRLGSKRVLAISMLMFSGLTFAKTLVGTVGGLAALQFLAALPIGGAYPIALSMVAENTPSHRRAGLLVMTSLGFTLGATLAGFIAAPTIENLGWRAMFYIGAALPILLTCVALPFIPESLLRLVQRGGAHEEVVAAIARVAPSMRVGATAEFIATARTSKVPIAQLFAEGRMAMTIVLWVGFIAAYMVYYFLFSWIPILLSAEGMSINQSLMGGAIYPAGGFVAGLLFAYLSSRISISKLTGALFLLSTISIIMIGIVDVSLVTPTLFVVGIGSVGGILAGNALASLVYPAEMRSAGIGWAFGLGRFGSMLGPVLGGVMIELKLSLATMCVSMAVLALVSATAFFLVGVLGRSGQGLGRKRGPAVVKAGRVDC